MPAFHYAELTLYELNVDITESILIEVEGGH